MNNPSKDHLVSLVWKGRTRSELLGPDGSIVRLKVYAVRFDKETAERVAADLVRDNPEQIESAKARRV